MHSIGFKTSKNMCIKMDALNKLTQVKIILLCGGHVFRNSHWIALDRIVC